MKHARLTFRDAFEVVCATAKAQAAVMTRAPGEATGGDDNVHARSDQWLFVVSGNGEAIVAGKRQPLAPHSLIVMEAGEPHQIRNTGDTPLETPNLYTPPEY